VNYKLSSLSKLTSGRSRLEGRYSALDEPATANTCEPKPEYVNEELYSDVKATYAAKLRKTLSKSRIQRTENISYLQNEADPFYGYSGAVISCTLCQKHPGRSKSVMSMYKQHDRTEKTKPMSEVVQPLKINKSIISEDFRGLIDADDLNLSQIIVKKQKKNMNESISIDIGATPDLAPLTRRPLSAIPFQKPSQSTPSPEDISFTVAGSQDSKVNSPNIQNNSSNFITLPIPDLVQRNLDGEFVNKTRSLRISIKPKGMSPKSLSPFVSNLHHLEPIKKSVSKLPSARSPYKSFSRTPSPKEIVHLENRDFHKFTLEEAIIFKQDLKAFDLRERERQQKMATMELTFTKACEDSKMLLEKLNSANMSLKDTLKENSKARKNRS
jgi:hypothetical protein